MTDMVSINVLYANPLYMDHTVAAHLHFISFCSFHILLILYRCGTGHVYI